MSRQDRLSADVERGFEALENGEFEEAAACLERCSRIDRKHADVVTLAAALADAQGETETALAKYRELSTLRPDDPMPRVCVARLQLHDEGDPEAALESIESAFEFIDEEDDLIAAVLVRTEALIAMGDLDNAKESLDELASSVIDDPELALDLGELALATGDTKRALEWAKIAQGDEKLRADALHLLGFIHEAREDRAAAVTAWQEVRAIDAKAPAPKVSMSEDEMERIARETLAELSDDARKRLADVPILIEDVPSPEMIADGEDPRMLGLFEGEPMRPLSGDDDLGGGPSAGGVATVIHLYKSNLERTAADLDDLAEQVRITVLHETAHFFGLDEDELTKLGLD